MTDEHITSLAPDVDLVVQCTPLGIAGGREDFETLEFVKALPESAMVADVLYPRTKLLDAAKARGLKIVNGMGMMIYQQFAMMEFRFGVTLPDYAAEAAEDALAAAIAMRDLRMRRHGHI
jgi:shikimate dehydrogenase